MSGLKARIADLLPELRELRRDLHAHPEIAFQEERTGNLVARHLEALGVEVHRMAKTGVVGVLRNGEGPAIGLRADLDALAIEEATGLPYASRTPGRMHACGHDGHIAMLLGAARCLVERRRFRGTVVLIFQPAEENEGGGRVMVEEGLFERFPVDAVFGLHNWPGLPVGRFAARPGPMMASYDVFEIVIRGRGAHAAMPQHGVDPVVAAAQVVSALQTLVSRNVDPLRAAVVSVTQMQAGDTWNVIPATATLRGTARSLDPAVQGLVEEGIGRVAEHVCAALGAECSVSYQRRYPPTVNTEAETRRAWAAASEVMGPDAVDRDPSPSMGAEDFAFMLRQRPGCYAFLGNGVAEEGRNLHSPLYDFNDDALPVGIAYWLKLVEGPASPG